MSRMCCLLWIWREEIEEALSDGLIEGGGAEDALPVVSPLPVI